MSKALRLSDELVAQVETSLSYKAHEKIKAVANRQSPDSALEQASTPEGKKQARRIIRATSSRRVGH